MWNNQNLKQRISYKTKQKYCLERVKVLTGYVTIKVDRRQF